MLHSSSIYLLVLNGFDLFGFVHAIVGGDYIGGCCSVCGSFCYLSSVKLKNFRVVYVFHAAGFKWQLRRLWFCLKHVETVSMPVCLILFPFSLQLSDLIHQVLCKHSLYQHDFPLLPLSLELLLLLYLLFPLLFSVSRILKEILPWSRVPNL